MLTLLIATGARPEAWAISEKLLARQTYAGPVRLVVVDDGPTAQPVTLQREGWEVEVIRPEPYWSGANTQARNLTAGLAVIPADARVVLWEDDDWYAPEWLETVAGWLESSELVGESHARYFNVATGRGHSMRNTGHASLCSTACRGAGLAAFRQAVKRRQTFIDVGLWRAHCRKALYDSRLTVGIKGLPGRGGIGAGHRATFGTPDPDGLLLREWIGDDVRLYL